jgi:predicted transcriptional regulator
MKKKGEVVSLRSWVKMRRREYEGILRDMRAYKVSLENPHLIELIDKEIVDCVRCLTRLDVVTLANEDYKEWKGNGEVEGYKV